MISSSDIEVEVLRTLRTLTPRDVAIRLDDKLIADLRLLSDDATAMALELERKYRVKVPRKEWQAVLTVQDIINLLARHVT